MFAFFALQPVRGRRPGGFGRGGGVSVPVAVVGRAVDARQATGLFDAGMRFELDSCVLANLGYEFSESALSDTISKSACGRVARGNLTPGLPQIPA
ncbi:hypothetical protein GCM10009603_06950 [Nocardiopsis exhalans]